MKTLVLSMISIAATVAAMTACTSESDPVDEVGKDSKVEIKLNAGVGNIITKAAVENTNNPLNIFFCKSTDGATSDWGTAEPIYSKIETGGAILFYTDENRNTKKQLYYNADETLLSWLSGCYLGDATIDGGGQTLTNNSVSFTIDGQDDIMATNGLSGSKKTNFASFEFNHLLSNLEFVITTSEDATAQDITNIQTIFGKVTSIDVLDQSNNLTLTLTETPALTVKGATKDKFSVTNAINIEKNKTYGNIMVFPTTGLGKTDNLIKIKVHTEKSTADGISVDVKIGDGTVGLVTKTKYEVTLKFSPSSVSATATIGEWKPGEGSGTVE